MTSPLRHRTSTDSPTITEHPTAEGKLYLCAIKDCHSNRVVGYSIDSRMKASLAVSALRNAIGLRDPAGTVAHSDRGPQFHSRAFVRILANNGLVGSMGRVGACGDNAAMKSLLALPQKNVLDRQRWNTREELRLAIVIWIKKTYHRRRRQRALGRLTPIKFEPLHDQPATTARSTHRLSQQNSGQSPVRLTALGDDNAPSRQAVARRDGAAPNRSGGEGRADRR